MKIARFILLSFIVVFLSSCNNDDVQYEYVNIAIPEVMSKIEFRSSIEILSPQNLVESGKIYAYENYIFVNDAFRGIHIIDNSNPSSPQAKAYIKISGNIDISIKNNYLYADNSIDLVVFDISNIENIQFVSRLEDVFSAYDFRIPEEANEANFSEFNPTTQVIVGWSVSLEKREVIDDANIIFANAEANIGTGGSLARFQIVDNYLYTVGNFEMNIFNIQNLSQPVLENTQYSGWNIETMFEADDYLYLGSTNGLYIYSLSNPELPEYVSEITHWKGCDPVVVDENYAYLTLRGGNLCGQQESELQVIDVSNKFNPTLVETYALSNPYGLGFKNDNLFVCDGTSGLKIFDKTNPLELELNNHLDDIIGKDVIPLENTLIMIGDDMLYQYEYVGNTLNLISSYQL